MFRWYTNEFKYNLRDKPDVTEIIDIFTCEDIISSHVRISYRFYQFVTTRYTTDFYIINPHIPQTPSREYEFGEFSPVRPVVNHQNFQKMNLSLSVSGLLTCLYVLPQIKHSFGFKTNTSRFMLPLENSDIKKHKSRPLNSFVLELISIECRKTKLITHQLECSADLKL